MAELTPICDIFIHRDDRLHCAMPSAVRMPDGELLVAFRRAPDRRAFGVPLSHCDAASHLVLVRSRDEGESWTPEPELLFAHPLGGSQDPCLFLTDAGTLLCSGYGYLQAGDQWKNNDPLMVHHGPYLFLGGFLVRSRDGGFTWHGPIEPEALDINAGHDYRGLPYPPFNRGALAADGKGGIFWPVTAHRAGVRLTSSIELLHSGDDGLTWGHRATIARSESGEGLNESSLCRSADGDLLCFIRRIATDDFAVLLRSRDGGRSWTERVTAPWRGHPFHALTLPGGRILLTYGYRHAPIGIRARLLAPDASDFATAPEYILRDDGGSWDVGYPWSVLLDDRHALVVYYFNTGDGPRHIAGTVVEIG